MIIQIEMPLVGTWFEDIQEGDPNDVVKPLPLPFNLSYRCEMLTKDVVAGTAVCGYDIDDAELTPALIAEIMAFVLLSPADKRVEIAGLATKQFDIPDAVTRVVTRRTANFGTITGTFRKERESEESE